MMLTVPTIPYAILLLVCLLLYFIVYPFVEYIRDPKGTVQHIHTHLSHNFLKSLANQIRSPQIPKHVPLLGHVLYSVYDSSTRRIQVHEACGAAQEASHPSNRTQYPVVRKRQSYQGHLRPQH